MDYLQFQFFYKNAKLVLTATQKRQDELANYLRALQSSGADTRYLKVAIKRHEQAALAQTKFRAFSMDEERQSDSDYLTESRNLLQGHLDSATVHLMVCNRAIEEVVKVLVLTDVDSIDF